MSGEWRFEFVYAKKESLKVRKYQELLLKIREEFEPKFTEMKPEEGEAEWAANTDGKAPPDNMYAQFTYKCTKTHLPSGADHGTWTLLWNPKKADIKNNLHARCAPKLFKELSNEIQKKLVKEFPQNFKLTWNNGIDGYSGNTGNGNGGGVNMNMRQINQIMRVMRQIDLAARWEDDDDDRCPHHIPWAYCRSCSGNS